MGNKMYVDINNLTDINLKFDGILILLHSE